MTRVLPPHLVLGSIHLDGIDNRSHSTTRSAQDARIWNQGAELYLSGRWDEARVQFLRTFALTTHDKNRHACAESATRIGHCFSRTGDDKTALEWYRRAHAEAIASSCPVHIAHTTFCVANGISFTDPSEEALEMFARARARYRDLDRPELTAMTDIGLGFLHAGMGHHREAVDAYRRAHEWYLQENPESPDRLIGQLLLVESYLALGLAGSAAASALAVTHVIARSYNHARALEYATSIFNHARNELSGRPALRFMGTYLGLSCIESGAQLLFRLGLRRSSDLIDHGPIAVTDRFVIEAILPNSGGGSQEL